MQYEHGASRVSRSVPPFYQAHVPVHFFGARSLLIPGGVGAIFRATLPPSFAPLQGDPPRCRPPPGAHEKRIPASFEAFAQTPTQRKRWPQGQSHIVWGTPEISGTSGSNSSTSGPDARREPEGVRYVERCSSSGAGSSSPDSPCGRPAADEGGTGAARTSGQVDSGAT